MMFQYKSVNYSIMVYTNRNPLSVDTTRNTLRLVETEMFLYRIKNQVTQQQHHLIGELKTCFCRNDTYDYHTSDLTTYIMKL